MRIGSDVEKQRQYEQKLADTIDAKAKINQVLENCGSFRQFRCEVTAPEDF